MLWIKHYIINHFEEGTTFPDAQMWVKNVVDAIQYWWRCKATRTTLISHQTPLLMYKWCTLNGII